MMTDMLQLLQQLIATPSYSKEEDQTAGIIQQFLNSKGINAHRKLNNVWAFNQNYDSTKPTVLLNSHHDTVRPVSGWKRNPFEPSIEDGKLFGLGSNDAGASLVGLLATFWHYYETPGLPFNLLFLASAEEEISGKNGVAAVLPELGNIAYGIVGEPTQMQMAIAEKGLMVVDAVTTGKAGHAARDEGENAIYKSLQDIYTIKNHKFPKVSELLGEVKVTVTQINAGTQHNVIPDTSQFVIDIRTNEHYTNKEVHQILQNTVQSKLQPRSFRLGSSSISKQHPIVQKGMTLGLYCFGSPTLSDQALMPFPTLKIGIGNSSRSHTADEFVYLEELEKGIELYKRLLAV